MKVVGDGFYNRRRSKSFRCLFFRLGPLLDEPLERTYVTEGVTLSGKRTGEFEHVTMLLFLILKEFLELFFI